MVIRLVVLSVVVVDRRFGDDRLESVTSIGKFRKSIMHCPIHSISKRIMTDRR